MKKGLTYEQQYGEERAKEIKKKLSEVGKRPNSGQFKKESVPWIKGKHHTIESIEMQKVHWEEWYNDPKNADQIKELKIKRKEKRKEFFDTLKREGKYEGFKKQCGKKISEGKKGKKFTDVHKKALSKAHWTKKEGNEKILEKVINAGFKKGHDSWNKGLTKETDTRMANSIASQPHSEDWNEKVSIGLKNSEKHKEAMSSEKTKEKIRQARMKQRIPTHHTEPEMKFARLIEKYNLPYKYVGDGQFWLGYPPKNPDFLNINGEKTVVEIHGVYWHLWKPQKENPNLTRKMVEAEEHLHYSKYGFKSVIIWEDELDNDEFVLNKLV